MNSLESMVITEDAFLCLFYRMLIFFNGGLQLKLFNFLSSLEGDVTFAITGCLTKLRSAFSLLLKMKKVCLAYHYDCVVQQRLFSVFFIYIRDQQTDDHMSKTKKNDRKTVFIRQHRKVKLVQHDPHQIHWITSLT